MKCFAIFFSIKKWKSIVKSLSSSSSHLISYLSALGQLARISPTVFEKNQSDIVDFVVKEVILAPVELEDMESEWIKLDNLGDHIKAKVKRKKRVDIILIIISDWYVPLIVLNVFVFFFLLFLFVGSLFKSLG